MTNSTAYTAPPLEKLKQRTDFNRLTRFGQKWAMPGLVLQVAPRPDKEKPARVGFTTSKKVGNAVARNRARRRLRALAQQVLAAKAQPSLDYVLVGRHTTLTRSWDKLIEDLEVALKKVAPPQPDTTNKN